MTITIWKNNDHNLRKQLSDELTTLQAAIAAATVADADYGDITVSGTGTVWTIDNKAVTGPKIDDNAVTNAKLAQMATLTIKGNNTGGTANALDLTATQLTAMLNAFTSVLKGLVPASGGGTTTFLRADGTFAAPAAGSGASLGVVVASRNGLLRN